jgi:NADP-dependent aldehyde dehydrogenase
MKTLQSINARTGQALGARLYASTPEQVDACASAAGAAFADWSSSDGATRAALLRGLAGALESDREGLVALADEETGLGSARLNGELDRTAFQLRRFADIAKRGVPFEFLDDPAVAGGPPPRPPAKVGPPVAQGPGWKL